MRAAAYSVHQELGPHWFGTWWFRRRLRRLCGSALRGHSGGERLHGSPRKPTALLAGTAQPGETSLHPADVAATFCVGCLVVS